METHFDDSEIALHGRFTLDPNDARQSRFEVKIDAGEITFAETSDEFSTREVKVIQRSPKFA